MGLMKSGVSAVGKLLVVMALAVTFLGGMLGVVYYQLRGEEVAIPKVVGKNFNDGKVDLNGVGLRIKKIASRYSNEEPNTILEQRPRAGTTAKSGLMISVVVSEKNPDGNEAPVGVKDDDEAIKEIEDQPELKIDKKKDKAKPKKSGSKTRDVITNKPDEGTSKGDGTDGSGADKVPTIDLKALPKAGDTKPPAGAAKPGADDKGDPKKPKTNGDLRNRTVKPGN